MKGNAKILSPHPFPLPVGERGGVRRILTFEICSLMHQLFLEVFT